MVLALSRALETKQSLFIRLFKRKQKSNSCTDLKNAMKVSVSNYHNITLFPMINRSDNSTSDYL